MLARNFLSAEALGLDEPHRQALITVLGMMERGEIEYFGQVRALFAQRAGLQSIAPARPICPVFNMLHWRTACGTVMCIGGWAEHVSGLKFKLDHHDSSFTPQLARLFWPHLEWLLVGYEGITMEEAIRALSNYLTTGEPRWKEVLGVS